jgi:hypothetical protein
MGRLLRLRFLDQTDKENPSFVTAIMDGHLKGYFKREPKHIVVNSADGTSCKTQNNLLTEARTIGVHWHQIDKKQFEGLLGEFNAYRTLLGWEPIELPQDDNNDDNNET